MGAIGLCLMLLGLLLGAFRFKALASIMLLFGASLFVVSIILFVGEVMP